MVIPGATPAPDASSSLTYEPHYGLAEKPFSLAVNPKFLYKSPTHRVAFDRLLAGIRRREGLIVLTGEVGTGKTTVCRAVIDALDRRTFSAFVPDPFVTREDLLKAVLTDFGVVSTDDIKAGRLQGASRQDLSHLLYAFLHSIAPLDAFAVIVVDEAQNLSLPVLEEIRILSEFETGERMLQVVLVGQPELRAHLKLPEMRQMNQRVSVRAELSPLDADGVAAYVSHRLGIAAQGAEGGVTFTPDALDAVWRASAGVPRLVNKLCDRSLEGGHAAGVTVIDVAHVNAALDTLELPATAEPPPGYAVPVRLVSSHAGPLGARAAVLEGPSTERVAATPPPIVLTAPRGDAGLDAFASEGAEPAPPVGPPPPAAVKPKRPRPLPTLFEPHAPALGRTSDAKPGWLTKLWRASIYLLALGGAIATSGMLDQRTAPWHRSLTPLPTLPPAPPPVFGARVRAARPRAGGPASATATPAAPMRATFDVVVTAPDPAGAASSLEAVETPDAEVPREPPAAREAGREPEATLPDTVPDGLDEPVRTEP